MEPGNVTQEQLEQCCQEWQKRLRLQDWKVNPSWARANEMGDRLASIAPRVDHKSAVLTVARPEDYDEENSYDRDWEHHVVHELLHLHWAFLPADHPQLDQIEQAIELTTLALVKLKREMERIEIAYCEETA